MKIYGRIALIAAGLVGLGVALVLGVVHSGGGSLKGQVLGAGAPIAKSTVILWATSTGGPMRLAQTRTGEDGRFEMRVTGSHSADAVLYMVAIGGRPTAQTGSVENPAITLMTVLGTSHRRGLSSTK